MSKEIGSGHAFPHLHLLSDGTIQLMGGLTKRELFAAMAMQGLSSISPVMVSGLTAIAHPDWISLRAVNYADALILELEKTK